MTARFCDELPFGFSWIAEHPRRLRRASPALADDGQVWLVDSGDALEVDERVRAFGKLVGVIQLLDGTGETASRSHVAGTSRCTTLLPWASPTRRSTCSGP